MSLTSDEVNLLVYRYLLESGFVHSAFAFGFESHVSSALPSIDADNVPPGALVSYIQKGLQLVEMETHVNDDGMEVICDEPFSVLHKHSCEIKAKRKLYDPDSPIVEDFGILESTRDEIHVLERHHDVVTCCAWNSTGSALASGCQDASIYIWRMNGPEDRPPTKVNDDSAEGGIVVLDWSDSSIASGCFDGSIQLWKENGSLIAQACEHEAPVSALRWNSNGSRLCTGGLDGRVLVWDSELHVLASSDEQRHRSAVFDVDWKDDDTFASCGADHFVLIHNTAMDEEPPEAPKRLAGHASDVNCVRWQPSGRLLASASDDLTVKLWSMNADRPVQELKGHQKEVMSLSWAAPSSPLIASGSLDTTARLWDVEKGITQQVLERHLHPVTLVSFSKDANVLATCSNDRLYLYSTRDGALIRTFRAQGGINDLCWHPEGTSVAVACTNHSVVTLDLVM